MVSNKGMGFAISLLLLLTLGDWLSPRGFSLRASQSGLEDFISEVELASIVLSRPMMDPCDAETIESRITSFYGGLPGTDQYQFYERYEEIISSLRIADLIKTLVVMRSDPTKIISCLGIDWTPEERLYSIAQTIITESMEDEMLGTEKYYQAVERLFLARGMTLVETEAVIATVRSELAAEVAALSAEEE